MLRISSNPNAGRYIVLAIYAAFVFVGISRHEIWWDEAQWFLIARDAPSLGALFFQLHREGHPLLGYLLLRIITGLGGGVVAMQVFQGAVALGVGIVLSRFKMKTVFFAAILFGYYFVFEYAVIARPYALANLFLLLGVLELNRGRRDWQCGAWFGLACMTMIIPLILVVCMVPLLVRFGRGDGRSDRAAYLRFCGLVAIGVVIAVISARPVVEGNMKPIWSFTILPLSLAVTVLQQALYDAFCIGAAVRWPAGWHAMTMGVANGAEVLAFLAALVFAFRYSGRRGAAMFFIGTCALLYFFLTRYSGTPRQHGYIWVLWILSLLMNPQALTKIFADRGARIAMLLLLGLQIPRGALLLASDIAFPFSQSKNAAQWIAAQHPSPGKGGVRFASSYFDGQSANAYLDGVHFDLATSAPISYLPRRWNDLTFSCPDDDTPSDLLVLTNPLEGDCDGYQLERAFTGALVNRENYWIYRRIRASTP